MYSVHAGASGGQQSISDPLELQLQAIVTVMSVLRTQLRWFAGAVSALIITELSSLQGQVLKEWQWQGFENLVFSVTKQWW